MQVLRPAIRLVRQYARPFVLLNFAYFGIICGGMAYGALDPEMRDDFQGANAPRRRMRCRWCSTRIAAVTSPRPSA